MSRHVSRKERWWIPTEGGYGHLRCLEGYIFPKGGMWHGMLLCRHSQRYLGQARRARQAQMMVEDAIACEKKGLGYPPVPRSGLKKRRKR